MVGKMGTLDRSSNSSRSIGRWKRRKERREEDDILAISRYDWTP